MTARLAHYAVAALLVRLADNGARVALTLLALDRTGGAAAGGVLVAALLVPHVVAAPAVGLLADRSARPALLTGAASLLLAGGLVAAAAMVGEVPLVVVAAVLVVAGCGGPALSGALSSRMGEIVPAQLLPRAFGLDAATYGVAGVAGPAVAAAATAIWSATTAVLVLAGCAVAGALVVALLPVRGRPDTAAVPHLRDGAKAIAGSRILAVVTVTTTLGDVPQGMLPVAAVVVAQAAGVADAAGWLVTALAGGALLGALAWTWRPAPAERAPRVLTASLVAAGVPLAVAAAVPVGPIAVGVLFVLSGVAQGPLTGAMFTARQEHAPAAVRGQVFTVGAGLRTTAEAGGAALAGLVAGLAPPVMLGLAAAFPLAAAAGGAAALSTSALRTPRHADTARRKAGQTVGRSR